MLLIAIAVKLSSAGPVFFSQERVGLNGQVFQMLKFRTMKVTPLQESETRWTTTGDPRRPPLEPFCATAAWTNCRSFSMCCAAR